MHEEASLAKESSAQPSSTTSSLKRIPHHHVKLRRVFVPRPLNGTKHAPFDDDFALGPCEPMSKPPRPLAHLTPNVVLSFEEPIDDSPFNDLLLSQQPRGSKMYSPSDIGFCSRRALLRNSYSNTMDASLKDNEPIDEAPTMDAPLKDDEPIDEAPTQDAPLDDAIDTSPFIPSSIK